MTDKTLEEKMNELERIMPGVKAELKYTSMDTDYFHRDWCTIDATYAQTERYDIVAGLRESHFYSLLEGGVGWDRAVTVIYRQKDSDQLRSKTTENTNIRNPTSSSWDRVDLWPFKGVGITPLSETTIEVYWIDREGNKKQTDTIDLDAVRS